MSHLSSIINSTSTKLTMELYMRIFFFQAGDGIRDLIVTGVQTCALPISQALEHDGPALVEVLVHRQELAMPPSISLEQVTGFGIFMAKAVLSGRGDELIDLAKTNLFR